VRMIALILKFFKTDHIIGKHGSITRRKTVVVGGLSDGVDHIIHNAVVPSALIEVVLHFRQLIFRPLETLTLFIACLIGAPTMIQISLHLHEDVGPPIFAAKTLFAIVIPVLGNGAERERRDNYACCKGSLHDVIPPGTIIAEEGREGMAPLYSAGPHTR